MEMDVLKLSVNPSREEEWNLAFDKAKRFYEDKGHLSTPDKTLNQWITYQRLHAKQLTQRQLTLLDSIRYNDAGGFRECDMKAWSEKISHLKEVYDSQGDLKHLPNALSTWISKQRQKARNGELEPKKRSQLEEMGIDFSGHGSKKDGRPEIRDMPRWNAQFENLKQFREIHDHCNVPKRYLQDKSLAAWVSAQRRRYKELKKKDVSIEAEWVDRLESIGFDWTRKQKRSEMRSKTKS
jgi:hypothetical protein